MKLRIISDLHLEHDCFDSDIPSAAADVVILAGDIHEGVCGLAWAAERFSGMPIIYIPGNHEFYGYCIPSLRKELANEAARLGIYLLDNQTLTLEGVRFYGTTLWSDFALYSTLQDHDPSLTEEKALRLMPDFSVIKKEDSQDFTITECRRLHAEALAWLDAELSLPFEGPRVVISHHAPLAECIPQRYQGDDLSPAFASHLPHLMGRMDLWIHGHVHEPVDLVAQGTHVFANPRGYPGEFVPPLFTPACIVEV